MSFIPRLFLPAIPEGQKEIILDESSSRYLIRVLRLKAGDHFFSFDSQAFQYELMVKKDDSGQVSAEVLTRNLKSAGSRQSLIALGQSLPKASKMDLILR